MEKIDRLEQEALRVRVSQLLRAVNKMYLKNEITRDELHAVRVHLWRVEHLINDFGKDIRK